MTEVKDAQDIGPMNGVNVVEVALYAFVPGAGAVLADWGARVVKIEHPEGGDPLRGHVSHGIQPGTNGFSFLWEVFNRGKRSVGIDLATPDGREVLEQLVREADVFLTNFLPSARTRLAINPADVQRINPRIIYARGSGFGPAGPEADRGGFDSLAYWYRTGVAAAVTPHHAEAVTKLPGPAFGDIQAGMTLAGGVAAALFRRERTGRGAVVDVSLLGAGMWAMQPSLVGANILNADRLPEFDRREVPNPLSNTYRTADARYVALALLQGDRYWQRFCELVDRPDLVDDPRFDSSEARAANNRACIAELDAIFEKRELAEWGSLLEQQDGQWAVVQNVGDLNSDPQALANGYLTTVEHPGGVQMRLVPAPVQFDECNATLQPAPQLGEHTDEVLQASGLEWDRLIDLKIAGVIT